MAPRTRYSAFVLLVVAILGCGLSAPSIEDGQGPPAAQVLPRSARAAFEMFAPAEFGGAELEVRSITGDDLDAADPGVSALLGLFGVEPGEIEIAWGLGTSEDGPRLTAGAMRVPGWNWTDALQTLVGLTEEAHGLAWEWVEVGGRLALRAGSIGDPDRAPVYYASLGDIVVFLQTDDEGAVASAMEGLPDEPADAGGASAGPPIPGSSLLIPVVMQVPGNEVCVGEDVSTSMLPRTGAADRQRIRVMALDSLTGVPYPHTFFFISGRLMDSATQPAQFGPMADFRYTAARFGGDGREEVLLQATSLTGGQGSTTLRFEVRHCLPGRWQDGDRVIRIVPPMSRSITAEVVSGEICGEEGGIDFTGEHESSSLQGPDLKVCNPQECVDTGHLPAATTVPFTGEVADDGMSVQISWSGEFFDLPSCVQTGMEDHTFTITRLSFWD